jgi:hypothetical protein
MKIKYKVTDEYGDAVTHVDGDVFEVSVPGHHDLDCECGRKDAAEECADHFWHECGGEDGEWPLTFIILGEGNEELGTYGVDVDTAPRFSASEA